MSLGVFFYSLFIKQNERAQMSLAPWESLTILGKTRSSQMALKKNSSFSFTDMFIEHEAFIYIYYIPQ